MDPDQAAALAPELARHLAAAGADVCTGERAGNAARSAMSNRAGSQNCHTAPSARGASRCHTLHPLVVREYWEKMPAHAPWILAVALSFITAPLVIEALSRRYWWW